MGGQEVSSSRTIVPGDIESLMQAKDARSLEEKLGVLKTAPLYQRLWLSDRLSDFLGDGSALPLNGYQAVTDQHDLRRMNGRAAHAIEALMGMHVSVSRQHETEENLQARRQLVRAVLKAQKDAKRKKQNMDIQKLQRDYSSKVRTGMHDNAMKSARVMLDLFDEWFPLGASPVVLKDILGIEGVKNDKGILYAFEDSFTEFSIQLVLDAEDGTIQWVTCEAK